MAIKMVLPMLGQTMEEGTIIRWMKNEGDAVEKGEPILEVMTDKVNMEVEADESGVLRKILAAADEVVPILAPICIIGTADESIDDLLVGGNGSAPAAAVEVTVESVTVTSAPAAASAPASSSERVFISPRAKKLAGESGISIEALRGRGTGYTGRVQEADVLAYLAETSVQATPLASRVAADKGVSLGDLAGSGPRGKIMRDDVLLACQPSSSAASAADVTYQILPYAGLRKMVGDNVLKSAQTAPHVTLTAEIDMTDAVELRTKLVGSYEAKYGVRLTFTHLLVKAAAMAIAENPILNASLVDKEIRIPSKVNIGVAVPMEGGLIVPVLHGVEGKSVAEIAVETKSLIGKAKSNSLSSDEISGGTFSISNLGAYGIDVFNPIITPGQSAILGVCRIVEKPVVVNGQIAIRSMMNLCLSFDHRVMDGAPAAQFLKTMRDLLESPYQLII